jgi:bacillithiol biosynthesis cysteine-adding enzyme BshC
MVQKFALESNPFFGDIRRMTHWLDYRALPPDAGGFTDLFLAYLENSPAAESFFVRLLRDPHVYETVMEEIALHPPDRQTLATVLRTQNERWGCGRPTQANITLLQEPSTYAVVTGQQVGLLGGPLYTVYKTITAIDLAVRLKARYPSANFVPVFWLEGEDHDFAEVNHLVVQDNEGKPARVEYLPGGVMPERNPGAVGEMVFDATCEQTLSLLEGLLGKTEFTGNLLQRVRDAYGPGRTFNESFARWMHSLFADAGLVFMSVNDPALKRLAAPLFIREISGFPASSQLVIDRSAELEKEFHAQVKPRSVNLFMFHKGGRYLIEPREHDFSLKGTRHFIGREEMLRLAEQTPEVLSPNVVLRPLVQDTLLPTVAYVGGPAEIAYHAQIAPLYSHFGVVAPVLYPRASVTILEERVTRFLDRYNLTVKDLFADPLRLPDRVITQIAEVNLESAFARTEAAVHGSLEELKFGLQEIDPTLVGAFETARGKIDGAISVLKDKSLAAQVRKNDTAVRQVQKALNAVLPEGTLQERRTSLILYLNKYGPDVIRWLFSQIDIGGFKHQVLTLE